MGSALGIEKIAAGRRGMTAFGPEVGPPPWKAEPIPDDIVRAMLRASKDEK